MVVNNFSKYILAVLGLLVSVSCLSAAYSGGSGDTESPYKLATAEDIIALAENEGNWGLVFELVSDIDLVGIDFKPFTQDLQNGFGGTINGNGFAIRNLTIKGIKGRYVGFFGVLARTATIENLHLYDVDIDVATPQEIDKDNHIYVGALGGISMANAINCTVTGRINASSKNLTSIGGLFGRLEGATVDHCHSAVSIRAISLGQCFAGGFVGYCQKSNMLNNISKSNIYADGSDKTYIGGITGYALHTSFNSCCSKQGRMLADCGGFAGGITGYCYNGQIMNCFAENDVFSFSKGFAGGLTAGNYNSIIQNSYFAGRLSLKDMDSRSGAIAGFNAKSQILNCFWVYDASLSSEAISEGMFIGTVKTLTRAQIAAGGIFTDQMWNSDTPPNSPQPLWNLYENKLPTLTRTAKAANR